MKKFISLLLAVLMLSGILTALPTFAAGEGSFTDVSRNDWYYEAVEFCAARGIFKGVDAEGKIFAPNVIVTRAMLVTILARLSGFDETAYPGSDYSDVAADAWYAPAVMWAKQYGIAGGIGDGRFDPDGEITREQMAKLLYQYDDTFYAATDDFDNDVILSFGDLDSLSSWARIAMRWATGNKIINGTGRINGMDRLNPKGVATRAQIAQLMKNYLELHPEVASVGIADGRQLFLDSSLVDTDRSTAVFSQGSLEKKEAVFVFDAPYETRDAVYQNILYLPDGGYRMYYKATASDGHRRICYIESTDGIAWTRARLLTNTYTGTDTNIVTSESGSPDNLFVFYDTNPDCPESERYKGIYGQFGDGLYYEKSPDGKSFFNNGDRLLITTAGSGCYFDTLNTVYWDSARGKYVAFVRGFHTSKTMYPTSQQVGGATRDIRYSESEDFITWSDPVPLSYNDEYDYQMYANAITPYNRDTGLYIGLPTRYIQRKDNRGRDTTVTDTLFMFSENLYQWNRTDRAFLTPGSENGVNWDYNYSDCYPCVGFIETPSAGGGDSELSFYMKEHDPDRGVVLYRYTIRKDGFGSFSGGSAGTTLVTKPLIYSGDSLDVNFATSANGKMRVTITDSEGNTAVSRWIFGDRTDATLAFDGATPTDFSGKRVTMTFELYEADIYSFKFN